MSRRRKIVLLAAVLLVGMTYFIPASDTPTSSAYNLLEPLMTQTAAAVDCNHKKCHHEGFGGEGCDSAPFNNCSIFGSTCTTTSPCF